MIPTPYRFEPDLASEEFFKIGQLMLRWSHIEHIIGNCLKRLLRLSDEEAIITVFALSLDTRLVQITELAKLNPMSEESQLLFSELKALMKGIKYVRNSVVHAIIVKDDKDEPLFHLRSKKRFLSKAEIFSCEEITNYAAHVVIAFRLSLGLKDDDRGKSYTLPDRPPIPPFLSHLIQMPNRKQTA